MKTIEYFLELRLQLKDIKEYQSFYMSISELADLLYCTPRNAKRLLKSMGNEGLIYWKPGGGRGNRSKLQFRRSLNDILPFYVQCLVGQGKFKEAIRWIKSEGVPREAREQCYRLLLKELSFPHIQVNELNQLKKNPSQSFTPTMIATTTGRWLLIDREHSHKGKSQKMKLK
ncbi:SgrR family transcriptional regulator [Thermoactinomyces sp. CICC 10521]|uniref:SgrR family transcriptional regulator n=1 Tax=Thermoactinomyces sp. CICC 10521 TaxID=2767426 RepID=UPI0018DE5C57|nr:SgrR family transcriptional regulator [Thermoactinomyces sp. CICC 10521]